MQETRQRMAAPSPVSRTPLNTKGNIYFNVSQQISDNFSIIVDLKEKYI